MIQPNELRIGNWIADHEAGGYFQIEEIYKDAYGEYFVSYRNGSIRCVIEELEPIPLTEELIAKYCGKYPHIEYVHQLQNIYFALRGEELTIKN